MRWTRAALALGLVALLATASPPALASGTFTARSAAGPNGPLRTFWLYAPSGPNQRPRPLVVFLHGCSQTAQDVAAGTRWNRLAEAEGFLVAYPEQRATPGEVEADGNGLSCWRWYDPRHQERGAGEPSTIAAVVDEVARTHAVDRDRVFVMGSSAGADMATVVGATYPDVFAAVGLVAGCPYRSCSDLSGALAHGAMGPRARPVPVFAVQGTADAVNVAPLGVAAVRQWLGTADLADDGIRNGSVGLRPSSVEHRNLDVGGRLGPPGRDPCVRPAHFPCAGGAVGMTGDYPVTVERYADGSGGVLVESWTVHLLGHAYPAGEPSATFTDPTGPDVTRGAWAFFKAHPRPRR